MSPDLIKSFLVGLGFTVDNASYAKFNESIKTATKRVLALYAASKAMAAGVFLGISKVAQGFEQLGYQFRIIAPSINRELMLRRELLKAYAQAGVNIGQAIQQSIRFNVSLAKTKFALTALYQSVAAKFFPVLTRNMDIFRKQIYANMPRIQDALEKFVKFVFKAFEATWILGQRVWSILQRIYDFFVMLDKATNGWSSIILGVVAAWKFLNLAFLSTPLGRIIAGFIALLALWDDFKTFKEGGQSLIDWGSNATKTIVGLVSVVAGLAVAIKAVSAAIKIFKGVMIAVNAVMALNPIFLIVAAVTALIAGLGVLIFKWENVKKAFSGGLGAIGDKVLGALGNIDLTKMIGGALGVQNSAPLGTGPSNNVSNQNVSQQTQINVQGSVDAQATAKAISNEQTRVNFDLVRNLQGVAQ